MAFSDWLSEHFSGTPEEQMRELQLNEAKRRMLEQQAQADAARSLVGGRDPSNGLMQYPEPAPGANVNLIGADQSVTSVPRQPQNLIGAGVPQAQVDQYMAEPGQYQQRQRNLLAQADPADAVKAMSAAAYAKPEYKTRKPDEIPGQYDSVSNTWKPATDGSGSPLTAEAPLTDYGKELEAAGLKRGTSDFIAAMNKHREKQDFIPGESPLDIQLKNATLAHTLAETDAAKQKNDLLKDIPDGVQGEELLKTLSPTERAAVEQVVSGAVPMPTSTANPKALRIRGLVGLVDPTYTATRYKNTQDYAPGGRVGAPLVNANTAITHFAGLVDAAEGLGNVDTPLVGKAINSANQGVKSMGSNPNLNDYRTHRNIGSEEMVKYFRNSGGSNAEVERTAETLADNASFPEALATAESTMNLVRDRMDQQAFAYNQTAAPGHEKTAEDLMSPEARAAMAYVTMRKAALQANKPWVGGNYKSFVPPKSYKGDADLWYHMTPKERSAWKRH